MATATLGGVIAAARQLIPPDPDAELLRRFAATRDDDAFAELVARYGRLVLSACRRIVPDTHLADDAFQATFVVLATRAATLDGGRPLGPWLYAVASHVATRARAMIGRRRKRETLTGTVPDVPAVQPPPDDTAAILDEEIGKLSAAYRDAVVLCELQGLTRRQAAAKLGIAEGTLSSRLAAARKTLAARLTARGVVPTAGIFSAIFVPTDLATAAVAGSTGKVVLSPQVTTLVQKGLAMTLLAKLKLVPAVLALGLLLLGAAGWGGSRDEAVAAPVPKAEKDDGLIWLHDNAKDRLLAYAPNGTKTFDLALPDRRHFGVSRDGAWVLIPGKDGQVAPPETDGMTLHRRSVVDPARVEDLGVECVSGDRFVFAPDGKSVVRCRTHTRGARPATVTYTHTLHDLATKAEKSLDLAGDLRLTHWSTDGKTWRLWWGSSSDRDRWRTMPAGGGKPKPICADDDALLHDLEPSPDGTTFVATGYSLSKPELHKFSTFLVSAATGRIKETTPYAEVAAVAARWSLDGKRLAVLRHHAPADSMARNTTLLLTAPDGSDDVTLFTRPDDGGQTTLLGWYPSPPKAASAPKKNAPVPKVEKDDGLIWTLDGKTGALTAFAPDGTKKQEVPLKSGRNFCGFSEDGELLLFLAKKGQLSDGQDGLTLHIGKPSDLAGAIDTGIEYKANDGYLMTRDKKRVVRHELVQVGMVLPAEEKPMLFRHTMIDLANKKETAIELPDSVQIHCESADGKEWIAMHYNLASEQKLPGYRHLRIPVNGGKPIPICDTHQFPFFAASPDRRSFLGIGVPLPIKEESKGFGLYRTDTATGKPTLIEQFADTEQRNLRWSPDGRRYAVKKHGDADVFAADIDGKNRKKLFAVPDAGPETYLIGWFPTKPAAAAPPKKNAPIPKPAPPGGVILVGRSSHKEPDRVLEAMDTAGQSLGYLPVGKLLNVRQARVSPDGKKLAFVRFIPLQGNDPNAKGKYYYPETVYVVDLPLKDAPAAPVITAALDPTVAWDADGKTLLVSRIADGVNVSQEAIAGKTPKRTTVRLDVVTRKETGVELPDGHALADVSPDGKSVLTRIKVWNGGFGPIAYSSFLVPLDTMKPERLGEEDDGFECARFSPDGTRVAGTRVALTKSKETGLFLADVGTGRVAAVPLPKEMDASKLNSLAWAPDGKRLAVLWRGTGAGHPAVGGGPGGGAEAHRVTVLEASGANAKTIREYAAGDWQYQIEWADPKLNAAEKAAPKKNAPVPEVKAKPNFFPHATGTKWVYRSALDNPRGPVTLLVKEVAEVKSDGADKLVTVRQWYTADPPPPGGAGPTEEEVFRVTADGDVLRVKFGKLTVDPPQQLLRAGMKDGDEWPFLRSDDKAKVTATFRVEKAEAVTVPAGTYTAVPVRMMAEGRATANVSHFADGVGAVRTGGYVLKEFKPGPPPAAKPVPK